MISGVNHITFSIRNLEESLDFYHNLLGFSLIAKWPKGAYLLAGNMWIALVIDEKLREKALEEYSHIAFTVSEEDFEILSKKIIDSGTEIFQKNKTEGASLYFIDPNGHKLEIHASNLETRIRSAKEAPWNGLEFFI